MKFLKIKLPANHAVPVAATGNYFRILSGTSDFAVTFDYGEGKSVRTPWKVGIGVHMEREFKQLTLESDIEQVVEVAYGRGIIDDSRLTGDVDINGLLSVVNSGGSSRALYSVEIPAGVATQLLVQDINRLTAYTSFDGTIFLGTDNTVTDSTGFESGSFEDSNTAALWAYSPSTVTVKVWEDRK